MTMTMVLCEQVWMIVEAVLMVVAALMFDDDRHDGNPS